VAQADEAALAEVDGIAGERIGSILASAREHVEELKREAERAAAEEAERAAAATTIDAGADPEAAAQGAAPTERESEAS
jgi:hypothetical protein